jgi:hypothetical protein
LDENQLTSYLALKLGQQERPLMTEPQVYLQEGQMRVFGKVQRGILIANIAIVVNVGVDEAGQPRVDIISSDLGPFPAPDGLNSAISAVVAEAYTGTLGPIATGFRLENITIAEGVMTLSGRVK